MKPAARYSLITLGVLALLVVLLAPVLYFVVVNAALKHHAKEDGIVFGSERIQEAIHDYAAKHGSPPRKLEDLIPQFLEAMPPLPEISKVDYRLSADGKEWTLDLYWTSRKVPLIFRRTNAGLSAEDANRRIDTEDGCYVLKAQ